MNETRSQDVSKRLALFKPFVEVTTITGYVLGASALVLQVFDDPLVRIAIAIVLIVLAFGWLRNAWKQAKVDTLKRQPILGPDERPLSTNQAVSLSQLQLPIAANIFATVLLAWVAWVNVPWALRPA